MAKKHVLIDIRPLLEEQISGVKIYTEELLKNLSKDKENQYSLFCNSWKIKEFTNLPKNMTIIYTKIPNKILNPSQSFLKIPKLDRKIKTKFDIFLSTDLRPIALSEGIKHIQILHDFSWLTHKKLFSRKSRFWFKILRGEKLLRKADKVVCVSNSVKNEAQARHANKNLIHIPPFIKKNKKINHKRKSFFFYVGTLEPRKNIKNMLKAFEIMQSRNPKAKLVIAGESSKKIFKNIEKIKQNGVTWLGTISEPQKNNYLSKALALVNLSIYEGFGLQIPEALNQKTPMLLSKINVFKENAGSAAIYAEPNDPENIAAKMEEIFLNKTTYNNLRSSCSKELSKWNNSKTLKDWQTIFKTL